MESYLNENFGDVKPKNSSEEALQRWRKLCWIVKNRKRRFRFTANLSKRFEAEAIRRSNQEKFRVAVLVSQAALQFIHGLNLSSEYEAPEEVKAAGFQICAEECGSIVEGHDLKKLKIHGGVENIAAKLSTSINDGGDDETPLQVKLNGVATIIGKVGLYFAVVTFAVLVQGLFSRKLQEGTPTETALLEFGLLLGGDFQAERQASKIVKVEPFNSAKKRMGVVIELPEGGFRVHSKGASEIVLAACDKVIDSKGDVVPLDEQLTNHLQNTIEQFASEALRTLCLAYMDIGTEFSVDSAIPLKGYTCIGIVGIKDPVRPGVKESVAICRSAGITVRMVTGDNINTAKAIAREIGILTDNGIAIEGPEFREKSEEELHELIPKIQVFNEISSREMEKINVLKGILKNHVFVAVLSCTVIFQIVIVEFLGTFASTCPLTWQQWFVSILFGFLGMPIAAALKLIPVGSS
ncbi:Cation-transporting P-type ATPase [Corchorus capsularis]|uniref:P-type Cu(+) transporter n=1 Tax=Corchorus capsularis TaxID=210143 RepID=A0A1R3H291_COCAP|nr:Cation-transporting P-type ATPase [Corchorus capsularis]